MCNGSDQKRCEQRATYSKEECLGRAEDSRRGGGARGKNVLGSTCERGGGLSHRRHAAKGPHYAGTYTSMACIFSRPWEDTGCACVCVWRRQGFWGEIASVLDMSNSAGVSETWHHNHGLAKAEEKEGAQGTKKSTSACAEKLKEKKKKLRIS